MNFSDYVKGTSPDWNPRHEYHILEDLDYDGIQTSKGKRLFIPFCVVEYQPRNKGQFGVNDATLEEVYPFAQWDDEVNAQIGEPPIILPAFLANDKNRYLQTAWRHYNSKNNMYLLAKERMPDTAREIYDLCLEKAEQWIRDYASEFDPKLHPFDMDKD